MSAWKRSLDAAGVRAPELRRDYEVQRKPVARFRRAPYLAARLSLPRSVLPHLVAATATMHHGDNDLAEDVPEGPWVSRWKRWSASRSRWRPNR